MSGTVAARRSKVVGGRKQPTAERALASGTVGVWDGIGKPFICSSSGVWDGRSDGDGKPLVSVLLGQHGRKRWGQKRGVRWQQQGRRLQVATSLAVARASESELAAAINVSERVHVGDGSGQGRQRQGQSQ